jgi:hypothetical protein
LATIWACCWNSWAPPRPWANAAPPGLEEFLDYLQHGREGALLAKVAGASHHHPEGVLLAGWPTRNVLAIDPAAQLVHQRPESPLPQILSSREIERLLATTAELRDARPRPRRPPHLLISLGCSSTGHQEGSVHGHRPGAHRPH